MLGISTVFTKVSCALVSLASGLMVVEIIDLRLAVVGECPRRQDVLTLELLLISLVQLSLAGLVLLKCCNFLDGYEVPLVSVEDTRCDLLSVIVLILRLLIGVVFIRPLLELRRNWLFKCASCWVLAFGR